MTLCFRIPCSRRKGGAPQDGGSKEKKGIYKRNKRFFSSHKFSNYYRIESSLVPYQFDEDMKDGEGVLATEKEGDEEERHKYNYFSGEDPLHNFASLTRAVIVAISSVFLFQSL